jgi:argininosuccinate lyase
MMLTCDIDYRSAYQIVGAAVRRLSSGGKRGSDLTVELLDEIAIAQLGTPLGLEQAMLDTILDPVAIVATRAASGGAAAAPMSAMLTDVAGEVAALQLVVSERLRQFDQVEDELRREARQILDG